MKRGGGGFLKNKNSSIFFAEVLIISNLLFL